MIVGYVYTKGKSPVKGSKFGKDHLMAVKPNLYEDYNGSDFAGVLDDSFIQIDVDNKRYENDSALLYDLIINKLRLKCNVIKTDRGHHFYFKIPQNFPKRSKKINALTPIQIEVDTNVGGNHTLVYYKINGKERKILTNYNDDEIDVLPIWLYPCKKLKEVEIWNLNEGDGRNDILFNYILDLNKAGFIQSEIKYILKIINSYCFSNPLSDKEFNNIVREESFPNSTFYDEDGKFKHNVFGQYLIKEYHIKKFENVLYVYEKKYKADYNEANILRIMLTHIDYLTNRQRSEVLHYIYIKAPQIDSNDIAKNLIGFKDYILDLNTECKIDYTPNIFVTNEIDYNMGDAFFTQQASENYFVDKTFNFWSNGDRDVITLFYEIIGLCLYKDVSIASCFLLIGNGDNGKSTFLQLIQKILGVNNYTTLTISQLNERFKPANLQQKLANLGDDIDKLYNDNTSALKSIVSGNAIIAERKGKDEFVFENYATLIFTANEMPRMNDSSYGLYRRLKIIPFNCAFDENNKRDMFFKEKFFTDENIEYILYKSVMGLIRVIEKQTLTIPKSIEFMMNEYKKDNDSVFAWLSEESDIKILNESTDYVYKQYEYWCLESNLKPVSRRKLSNEIVKHKNYKIKYVRIKGTNKRHYIFIES